MPEPVQILAVNSKQNVDEAWGDIVQFVSRYAAKQRCFSNSPTSYNKQILVHKQSDLEKWVKANFK